MDSKDFSPVELREFYSFLSKISNFEKIYSIQSDSLIFIIWGAIFIISAVSETIVNLTSVFKSPGIIWFVALSLGGLLTVTIENQVTFLRKRKFNLQDRELLLIIFCVVSVSLICGTIFNLNYLLFPLQGLIFFIFSYASTRSYVRTNTEFVNVNLTSLIPYSGLFSTIVSCSILLFATSLFNPSSNFAPDSFSNFESLIFAICIGPILILSGLLNNRKVTDFFLTLNADSLETLE